MKKLFFVLLILLSIHVFGADSTDLYKVEAIKKEMKENANTVVRYHRTEIEVAGPDKGIMKVREVLTILNAKGEDELLFLQYTDKFIILEDAELKLYDANGKLVERHKKKDLSSNSAGSGLVEDGKVYYLRLSAAAYPVTVEKEYLVRFRGIYKLPQFYFSQPYQSVENASLVLKHPASLKINHKPYNFSKLPKHTLNGDDEIWQWESGAIPSSIHESSAGDWRYKVPSINFNLSKFEYDGYAGDMSSWKNLGLWYNYLVGNTNRLSPRYQEEIRQRVSGAADEREKIRILYQHLQKNFRYVSIQLGIGGFKPFPADFVHEKKYGDCKGLSNYMEACLAALGIKSHNAWIKSGDNEIMLDPDFPHDGFDHQILLVPLGRDSIWLECTSNYNDFGHLGSFTENRYALVMTEQGGKLVKTPRSQAVANTLLSMTRVAMNEEGNAEIISSMAVTGEFKYLMINLSRISADKQKTYLIEHFGMNQPDEFNIRFHDSTDGGYYAKSAIFLEKLHDFKAGSKFFLKPRIFRNWTDRLPDTEKRQFDYFIEHPFIHTDTTIYELPAGFTVETFPKNRSFRIDQASYESKYWFDKNTSKLFSVARLEVDDQRIPAEKYTEAKKFFDMVLEDGNQKMILLKPD
jgi:hypothetical protein